MKCERSEVEIETIVNRIKNERINLQPNYQRGEIWSLGKKKKLIDSILRRWQIPPIHVVANGEAMDEVLDGQQRLAAIRDFYNDQFAIDGSFKPLDKEISALDGCRYSDLPTMWKNRFCCYCITIIRLTDYLPSEPAELFYRLNQPVTLTSAEQRNAYIGKTRNQVKELSDLFEEYGASKELLGFSNSRLAYDEILSKLCYAVEIGTLRKKITSGDISDMYREERPFSDRCIDEVKTTIIKFMSCINLNNSMRVVFSKATLFSWLVFVRRNIDIDNRILWDIIYVFEQCRTIIKGKQEDNSARFFSQLSNEIPFFEQMFMTFNQRAGMGSTDATSIIYRDIILELFKEALVREKSDMLRDAIFEFEKTNSLSSVLDYIVYKYNWGERF